VLKFQFEPGDGAVRHNCLSSEAVSVKQVDAGESTILAANFVRAALLDKVEEVWGFLKLGESRRRQRWHHFEECRRKERWRSYSGHGEEASQNSASNSVTQPDIVFNSAVLVWIPGLKGMEVWASEITEAQSYGSQG
jgi:hypothetical protein